MTLDAVKEAVRDVPDFPKPGILFKDITPILSAPDLFRQTVDHFVERHGSADLDAVAAIESRGFIFGAVVAYRLGVGIIPIRKQGKLPYRSISEPYDLEYGTAVLEMHEDACRAGDRILLFDDLLATGGTARAAARLIEKQNAVVAEMDFVIHLSFLNGIQTLSTYSVYAPIIF